MNRTTNPTSNTPKETFNSRCYSLKVRNDSMSPRIRQGEIIMVNPDKTPESGDDVVVNLRDGRMMAKVFLYRKGNEITFGSINDGCEDTTLPLEEIGNIHYVSALLPRSVTMLGSSK
jgi:phage repressor protein C with HTH and peptisase S24 domain